MAAANTHTHTQQNWFSLSIQEESNVVPGHTKCNFLMTWFATKLPAKMRKFFSACISNQSERFRCAPLTRTTAHSIAFAPNPIAVFCSPSLVYQCTYQSCLWFNKNKIVYVNDCNFLSTTNQRVPPPMRRSCRLFHSLSLDYTRVFFLAFYFFMAHVRTDNIYFLRFSIAMNHSLTFLYLVFINSSILFALHGGLIVLIL